MLEDSLTTRIEKVIEEHLRKAKCENCYEMVSKLEDVLEQHRQHVREMVS